MGFLLFLTTLFGCTGLLKEHVGKNYFDLAIRTTASDRNAPTQGEILLVKEFSIDPAFDSYTFVYRVGTNQYENDYYNEFINYPAKLITENISKALYSSVYFKKGRLAMAEDISYRLSGKIDRFYIDFHDKGVPKAILEIRITLEKKTGQRFNPFFSHTYVAEESVLSHSPSDLVSAWNTGLSKIMTQFFNDFKNTLL